MGTRGGGLNRFEREHESFTRFAQNPKDPASISNDVIRALYQDRAGRFWLGTDGGLDLLNECAERIKHYTEKEGLSNNAVWGIWEDDRGRLWLNTNNGLSRFDPQTEVFKNYTVGDGLPHQEFNRGAWFKSPAGEMYFGGMNGVALFHPDSIQDNPHVPPVVITSFKCYNMLLGVPII